MADRIIMLDHLSRGRVMLGLGPGALTTDADMIGIDPLQQRNALEEDVDVLKRLLAGETLSIKTDRYTLVEARTQICPHSDFEVAAVASPTGPRIAGKYGDEVLSIGAHHVGAGAGLAGRARPAPRPPERNGYGPAGSGAGALRDDPRTSYPDRTGVP